MQNAAHLADYYRHLAATRKTEYEMTKWVWLDKAGWYELASQPRKRA